MLEYANSSELEAYTTETLNMLKEFPYDLEEYFADDDLWALEREKGYKYGEREDLANIA